MRAYDVVVVGGGAIGMASAREMARAGLSVAVIDRGRLGGEASSAAAGMLGAQLEAHAPDAFYALCRESRAMYPSFADALFEETGIDVEWVENGILQLARSEGAALALRERMRWQRAAGDEAVWLEPEEVRELERGVVGDVLGALYLPRDGNVHAPRLSAALRACVASACDVYEGEEVVAVEPVGAGWRVRGAREVYAAERVVVAAGAWASPLLRALGIPLEVRPVKGQMLAVRPPRGAGLCRTVYDAGTYLVPKRDGTVVIGATEEPDAGYDKRNTVDGLAALLAKALDAVPGLRGGEWLRAWSGLRPRLTGDSSNPVIGPWPGAEGLILAVGHFRNGVLLAPITGRIVASAALGRAPEDLWLPFWPQTRFAARGGDVRADTLER
ncbi:glycine oxidase ThiO [Alicyclobacillus acidocaldarius]|uniref:glycine oxidase n=1 Tax=Alicyclobacillus acidocaldarius subsp. acidocaldarius (strain ATCC 27009 / DSM 446 / BCRC 14685 / JCM 5260 / KCTC 1825 / NBRC 15652 / NCIMB 11725 / NRRL B-14509 / 104-IA) TaxID=521098 RepID=C8WSK4_ALIAD|nr:glycine oxidase ThiO [Alicyclobacillus acidocaldarius]ACV59489.1 glycine oxidase ThiO [Alicyclobacillus acidocaldarius subsp. acidocaldarius DSM 446]